MHFIVYAVTDIKIPCSITLPLSKHWYLIIQLNKQAPCYLAPDSLGLLKERKFSP